MLLNGADERHNVVREESAIDFQHRSFLNYAIKAVDSVQLSTTVDCDVKVVLIIANPEVQMAEIGAEEQGAGELADAILGAGVDADGGDVLLEVICVCAR